MTGKKKETRPISCKSWKTRSAPLALLLCSAGSEGLRPEEVTKLASLAGVTYAHECLAWLEHMGLAFYWRGKWVFNGQG